MTTVSNIWPPLTAWLAPAEEKFSAEEAKSIIPNPQLSPVITIRDVLLDS